jgi:membrane fusion protein, adhesin transport system
MLTIEEKKELNTLESKEDKLFSFLFAFIFIIFCLLASAVYYFNSTKLNIIAETKGTVIPSSKVKVVQHLEGGIVKNIKVNVGDIVKKNAILLELEPTKTLADFSELEKRLVTLSINISRLRAESENKKLIFSNDIRQKQPNLVDDALKLFEVRNNKINATLSEQNVILSNERATLELLEEQIIISKALLEEQLTNRLTHLELLKEKSSIVSKIDNSKSMINKIRQTYNTEVRTLLLEEISEYDELLERKNKFKDNLNRTLVKAPEEGIIKQRFVDTIGGIIQPGSPLFEIVPVNDKLIISSKLSVDEIGYIKKHQSVEVKLSGKNNSIYESIDGKIITISPDAIYLDNVNEKPYYEIRIETEKNYFSGNAEKYFMYPGTEVTALINIGQRTISNYLLEPILSNFDIAFSEK